MGPGIGVGGVWAKAGAEASTIAIAPNEIPRPLFSINRNRIYRIVLTIVSRPICFAPIRLGIERDAPGAPSDNLP